MEKLNVKVDDVVALNSWDAFGHGRTQLVRVTDIYPNGWVSIDFNNQKYDEYGDAIYEEENGDMVYSYLTEVPEKYERVLENEAIKRRAQIILDDLNKKLTLDRAKRIVEVFGGNEI